MGVAASSLALLDKNGMLEPYKPSNADALMSQYVDKKNPPAWFGMDVWAPPSVSTPSKRKNADCPSPRAGKT